MQNNIFGTIGLLVITQLLGPHDFNSMKIKLESLGTRNWLLSFLVSSIFFYVEEDNKKKIHRGLEQFEFKYMMTVSLLLGELSF